MLSAVAARKARREAQQKAELSSNLSQPALSDTKHETRSPKPTSKRRVSERAQNKPESKKRKVAKDVVQARYFAQDASIAQRSIDSVDAEDGSDSSSEEDNLTGEGERRQPGFIPRPREWSPSAPLLTSSDEENLDHHGNQPQVVFDTGLAPRSNPQDPVPLSTWRPIVGQNMFNLEEEDLRGLGLSSISRGKLCIFLKDERLTLLGVYLLTVVRGSVAFAGTQLSPESGSHRVFAPWSSPLPAIECAYASSISEEVPLQLSSRLLEAISGADAVVIIQELRTGVEGLGRICRTFENVFSHPGVRPIEDMELEGVHYVGIGTQVLRPFVASPSWTQACRSVIEGESEDSRHVYVIQGSKKTGKSSFARVLLNNLLTKYRKVAFLECDLGQSEFTPGGMVALNVLEKPVFGPPFSHPSVPLRAHYIGSTSPRDAPRLYLEAIGALVHNYNVDVQFGDGEPLGSHSLDGRIEDIVPLIVNTMGWTKGLGAELATQIVDIAQPSHIFSISGTPADDDWFRRSGQNDSLPVSYTAHGSSRCTTHSLQLPMTAGTVRFTPADYRNISLISYFHAVFSPNASSENSLASVYALTWRTSLPLCAEVPYEVSVKDAIDAIILIGAGSEDVVSSELSGVINSALVGLVSYDHGYAAGTSGGSPTAELYTQGSDPPPPTISTCHGLAVIRSSPGRSEPLSELQLLTPIPSLTLARSSPRVLVKGPMELPVWGWLDFRDLRTVAGVDKQQAPYLRWGKGEGAGAERRRARRNLIRQGLH